MRIELPVLSFLCVALITLLSPLHWKSRNVAVLSTIIWLFVANLIQGINSAIWLRDATARYPVWCDISTKLLLGSHISVAASCACICQHLHFLSANTNTKQRQHRNLVECSICIFLPLVYMALHTLVQTHRFDLSPSFGCTASTYISSPAIILVWLPILILCSITLLYAGSAVILHFGRSIKLSDGSRVHLNSVNFTFLRPLTTAILISLFVLFSSIFSLYAYVHAAGGLRHWSWSQVHATMSVVFVAESSLDLMRIEVGWWVTPVSTFVYFAMTVFGLLCGANDESVFGFSTVQRWYQTRILGRTMDIESFIYSDDVSPSIILNPSPHKRGSLPGWNNTLRFAHSTEAARPKIPKIACDTPPSLSASSDTESDASFIMSTLNYVQSPTGRKALGLPSPTLEATPEVHVPMVTLLESVPAVNPDRLSVVDPTLGVSASPADSILSAAWPEPPSTLPISPLTLSPLPVSPTPSLRQSTPSPHLTRSTSVASSTISMSAYGPDASFLPSRHSVRPFEDSGVPSIILPPSSRTVRKMRSKDSFAAKALHIGRERPSGRRVNGFDEGVYMTVVQETL